MIKSKKNLAIVLLAIVMAVACMFAVVAVNSNTAKADGKTFEMEGASIGHVAYANGIPFGVLRVISDNADGESDMDFPQFCKVAADKSIKICMEFVRRF